MKKLTQKQKYVVEELLATLLFTLGAAMLALFYLYGQPAPQHVQPNASAAAAALR